MSVFHCVLRGLGIITIKSFTVMDGQTTSEDNLSLLDPVLGYREKLAGYLRFLSTLHTRVVR